MDIAPVVPETSGVDARRISPTDVAQFIRLDQCERYLRLRLYQRVHGDGFMRDYGVVPQSIPPLLTRSGADFEEEIEAAVSARRPSVNLAENLTPSMSHTVDNEYLIATARDLPIGETLVVFQPRLSARLGSWLLRGVADILRLERARDGRLRVLIADMKSTTTAKVEHRLQVAFYHEMLVALFAEAGIAMEAIEMAILYRGPADEEDPESDEAILRAGQRDAADTFFGTRDALLERVADPASYIGSVRDLVTDSGSTAERIAAAPFEEIPFQLDYKCDGCMFNEFCMKWSAERDDLSLLPHLTVQEKSALRRNGIDTVRDLTRLKDLSGKELTPASGAEDLVRRVSTTWPVGPRLDELIHRARLYRRWKGDPIQALPYIPTKGYGSLPYSDAGHNPNLVSVYIDAQHDYLQDRIYMLGSLVVASSHGKESPDRRRSVVHLTDGPPDTPEMERDLFIRWIEDTMRAIVELAAPDEEGLSRAPIHLIFFNSFEQRLLLEGLARHFAGILGATPLYDFVTQLAAFDSPIATFLDQEIRELKNYPMVCQSLQAVAAFLKFDWNQGESYREIFRTRMFDFWAKVDEPQQGERPWYTGRARFNSQIPLEYAYAAWDRLDEKRGGSRDEFATYRGATPDLLRGFHARRLEAMERIAHDFMGNKQTEKRSFDLPDLDAFEQRARTLAGALEEFVTIERHVDLGAWKTARLAPPERRVLSGETLIVRYCEEDQDPETADRNRDNERRHLLKESWKKDNPGTRMSKDQKQDMDWSQDGMRFRLRLECRGVDCDLDETMSLSTIREGDLLVLCPRFDVDSRLEKADQVEYTPTPKQMLYSVRAELLRIDVGRNSAGRAVSALAEVELRGSRGGAWSRGFVFGSIERPLHPGELYTLDTDPNSWYGYWCARVTEELRAAEAAGDANNALYRRLTDPRGTSVTWPLEAAVGQRRFLDGLDALQQAGVMDEFERSKRDYIGHHGDAPTLLVQGPPGTGKSFSTAFALFARLQGAMTAGLDWRVLLSCKTHAATDVLLKNVAHVRDRLQSLQESHPEIFAQYFDPRLLTVPLFRVGKRDPLPAGVVPLLKKEERPKEDPPIADVIGAQHWCVVAATPGGVYSAIKEKWSKSLLGHEFIHSLVLDEASQMNLPEAVMAALPLREDGQLIVVGDHRQMPPIVKHDWTGEPRRTFAEFRAYESLFLALLETNPPMIKFEESFRLHADMAEFLRQEIYEQDDIDYYSRLHGKLPPSDRADRFVGSVLHPDHPIVVIVHDEAASMVRNDFERDLIAPVLRALAAPPYNLDPAHGLGVVVPHRAQRASLLDAVPELRVVDPTTGSVLRSAVDTVERFQGDERTAIVVSATESDPQYLLVSGDFLLDPRRLTVALSRARRKIILVASRSVFNVFSADEETFANAQLWKNLLRVTCTELLWDGEQSGKRVEVWGNRTGLLRDDRI